MTAATDSHPTGAHPADARLAPGDPAGAAPDQDRRVFLEPPRLLGLRTISAMVLREMSTTYGRTPGGYVWAVLQPIGALFVISFGFSLMLRSPALGTSFMMFYATGYLPYIFYTDIQSKISGSLRYARALLAYPSVIWVDAVMGRFILATLTFGLTFSLVISGIVYFDDLRPIIDAGRVLTAIAMAALLGLGVGMTNAVLTGLYPVWANIWRIITRPMFLISGVLFLYDDVPKVAQDVLWWNPLIHITGYARSGFFSTYEATYVSLQYVFGIALVLILAGAILMRIRTADVLER